MRDAASRTMLRMKDTNKLLKNVLRALPAISAIPFFAPKKTSVVPFVLGAIGVAAIGGIAAVMVFSPRTRYRALDIAKDVQGKVLGQMDQLGISEKLGIRERTTTPGGYSNGLVGDTGASYQSTGNI
jgi:flagellar biosynthesis/type III secretory pathway M-ring protein FliF/YscJ